MGTLVYFYSFFSGSVSLLRACYQLTSHDCFSYAFYASCNDPYLRFFFLNFAFSLLLILISLLKSLTFGEFRLIELQAVIEKEGFRVLGIFFFLTFGYFTQNRLHSTSLVLYTLFSVALIAILSKRAAYLIVAPNPLRPEQAKISVVYALSIGLEWAIILHLKSVYDQKPVKADRMLCELLLFEHIMLMMRFALGFLKYTLSLWCLLTNNDFRVKFPWYSPLKNSCLVLSFAIYIGTVDISSFFSILSFGTTHDYILGIAKYWKKYKDTKSLIKNIEWLPTVNCKDKEEVCTICLQKLEQAKELPCKHLFHVQCLEIWFINKDQCPICRLNVNAAITNAGAGNATRNNGNLTEINALINPRHDTVDELSRLYELNFYTNKQPIDHVTCEAIRQALPKEIHKSSPRMNNGLYMVGAVEYGLPVPVSSTKCYNTSIMRKHASVLNTHLSSFYKTYRDHLQ